MDALIHECASCYSLSFLEQELLRSDCVHPEKRQLGNGYMLTIDCFEHRLKRSKQAHVERDPLTGAHLFDPAGERLVDRDAFDRPVVALDARPRANPAAAPVAAAPPLPAEAPPRQTDPAAGLPGMMLPPGDGS